MSLVAYKDLSREDLAALTGYLAQGMTFRAINEVYGVSRGRMKALLRREDVKQIVAEMKADFVDDLDAMQDLVVENLRELLTHPSAKIKLDAIDRWGRLSGRMKDTGGGSSASAEEIAQALMKQKPEVEDAVGATGQE